MRNFAKRIEALPNNRRAETVILVRELVRDMWNDGYSAAGIGRAMDKDHTTILHHLWFLGIDPSERLEKERKVSENFRLKLRLEREARKKKKDAERQKKREKALKMYKEGYTQAYIADVLGVYPASVQGLLVFMPEYHKIKEKRTKGQGVRKAVNKLTRDGKLLETYPSMVEAAKANKTFSTCIVAACKGRVPTAGGYKWEYAK